MASKKKIIFQANPKYSQSQKVASQYGVLAPLHKFDRKIFTDDNESVQKVCDFVLSLALFHNDLKDFANAFDLHVKRKPVISGINPENGEWGGVRDHLTRILLGKLWELLDLFRKHREGWKHPLFHSLVSKLSSSRRKEWEDLKDVIEGEKSKDPVWKKVMLLRQNIAFHYSPDSLGEGFQNHFFKSGKDKGIPYWSPGSRMPESRFYFADAAAETFTILRSGDTKEFWARIDQFDEMLNRLIRSIVEIFIYERGGSIPA